MFEIKMRAYAPDIKQMIYLNDPVMCFAELVSGPQFGLLFKSNSKTVCLTGYKFLMIYVNNQDSTGQDIYQDDIANITYLSEAGIEITERGVMRFNQAIGCWGFEINNCLFPDKAKIERVNVIGNIHQNPDLLQ